MVCGYSNSFIIKLNSVGGNYMNLKETIENLRSLKQEGGYWDFKRQWYDKDHKQDMLHDIICMANNIENRDAYIIIVLMKKMISLLQV